MTRPIIIVDKQYGDNEGCFKLWGPRPNGLPDNLLPEEREYLETWVQKSGRMQGGPHEVDEWFDQHGIMAIYFICCDDFLWVYHDDKKDWVPKVANWNYNDGSVS